MQTFEKSHKIVTEVFLDICQMTLSKHHFNELSVNETRAYGYHCPKNTQGFKIKANKELLW